jgi:toxin YoeB
VTAEVNHASSGPRDLKFSSDAWEDFEHWLDQDRKMSLRIRRLLKEVLRTPFDGTGKPEPLKHNVGRNVWSRRITEEHRLVYEVRDGSIIVHQCRYHY